MVETIYKMTGRDERTIERLILDENLHYIHTIFRKEEGLPEHNSNAPVYMSILRGTLTITLNDQEPHEYEAGSILKIPFQTKMNVRNLHDNLLEMTIIKAPPPKA
jgi:quercetin dioxygenase-like cupin family protein